MDVVSASPHGEIEVPLDKKWNEATLRRRCERPALLRFLETHSNLVQPTLEHWRNESRTRLATEVHRVLMIVKGTNAPAGDDGDNAQPELSLQPLQASQRRHRDRDTVPLDKDWSVDTLKNETNIRALKLFLETHKDLVQPDPDHWMDKSRLEVAGEVHRIVQILKQNGYAEAASIASASQPRASKRAAPSVIIPAVRPAPESTYQPGVDFHYAKDPVTDTFGSDKLAPLVEALKEAQPNNGDQQEYDSEDGSSEPEHPLRKKLKFTPLLTMKDLSNPSEAPASAQVSQSPPARAAAPILQSAFTPLNTYQNNAQMTNMPESHDRPPLQPAPFPAVQRLEPPWESIVGNSDIHTRFSQPLDRSASSDANKVQQAFSNGYHQAIPHMPPSAMGQFHNEHIPPFPPQDHARMPMAFHPVYGVTSQHHTGQWIAPKPSPTFSVSHHAAAATPSHETATTTPKSHIEAAQQTVDKTGPGQDTETREDIRRCRAALLAIKRAALKDLRHELVYQASLLYSTSKTTDQDDGVQISDEEPDRDCNLVPKTSNVTMQVNSKGVPLLTFEIQVVARDILRARNTIRTSERVASDERTVKKARKGYQVDLGWLAAQLVQGNHGQKVAHLRAARALVDEVFKI